MNQPRLRTPLFIFFISLMLGISSCSEEDPETQFNDSVATGKVGGQDWLFVEGVADLSDGEAYIDLFGQVIEGGGPCGFFGAADIYYVSFIVPNATGIYNLGINAEDLEDFQIVQFINPDGSGDFTTQGTIEIDDISTDDGIISGKINARLDDDNVVNGTFEVLLCES